MTLKTTSLSPAWFVIPRPNPKATARLFCLPYSGASASIFFKWAEELPSNVELVAVQYPGHGTRMSERLHTQIAPLVEALAVAIAPHLNKPFAFFGHSMGALVSFELAHHLRRQHLPLPLVVVASGHGAPHLPDRNPPMHALPEPEFLHKLQELDGTPPEVLDHPELRALLFPILRADFTLCETYEFHEDRPLDCPMAAFGGLEDYYVSREELEAWRALTNRTCTVRMFPGNHFFLNTARSLVVHALARELDLAMRAAGSFRP